MPDAMATARMSQEKKNAAAAVFDSLGLTASSAINQFYDFVIANKALPFKEKAQHAVTREDYLKAKAFIEGLSAKPANERLASLSLKEAKRERLSSKGYMGEVEAGT